MDRESCRQEAKRKLENVAPNSSPKHQYIAREMCRLLDAGLLEEEDGIEVTTIDLDYLISRLEIREGDDNPSLEEKWNHWLGMMSSFCEGNYNPYQI